jgi:putative toxin-antitoxin system antitoxin component (TIGR02293 family)
VTMDAVLNLAEKVFRSAESAQAWLNAPQFSLDNMTPLSCCSTAAGMDAVKDVLIAIENGVYQ